MELPLVTICVPNYNKAKFIERTLRSIYAQSYKNIELIVIDDCSTDGSEAFIQAILKTCPFSFQYHKNETNRGVCYTCNRGFKLAAGKYFQVLSSDDIILPNKISHQVNLLERSDLNTAFIYSPIKIIDEDDVFVNKEYFADIGCNFSVMPSGNIYEHLLKLNFIPALTTLIRTACIKAVGGYDETLRSEDWEISLLLSKQYKVLYDDTIAAYYRVEQNSLMHGNHNKALVYDSFCKTLMKHSHQNKLFDAIIYRNISKFALIIYANNGRTGKFWLKKSLFHSFSFKNLLYTSAAIAGIKYNAIKKWK